ncbi:hypothetical protein ACIQGZ_18025 [Streptomyces sp. NPDC092296]|uniref:SCO2584 family spore wall biosynthesis protein n=1 Tax=Streptomyces sp. NPDC092296 TaxID=3366012 RepID=UPI0037F55AC5
MPDDVGGSPYPDGADHGGADDAFAAVVFDESFIRAATVHEPSAHERMLAAVEARLELEATGGGRVYGGADDGAEPVDDGLPEELRPYRGDAAGVHWGGSAYPVRSSRFGRPGRRGGRHAPAHIRWHRPVAWFLAVIMGVSVIAVAVAAVYRGTGGGASSPPRPNTGNIGTPAVDQPQQPQLTGLSGGVGG